MKYTIGSSAVVATVAMPTVRVSSATPRRMARTSSAAASATPATSDSGWVTARYTGKYEAGSALAEITSPPNSTVPSYGKRENISSASSGFSGDCTAHGQNTAISA